VKLLVGLGNPGDQYRHTRHNIGFRVVERLADDIGVTAWQSKHQGELASAAWGDERLLLLKPMTYMNRSGLSARAVAAFFKIEPSDMVAVHDELDLPFGQLRLKQGGGDAGHNGLKSLTQELGSSDYIRLRMGIGRPAPDFSGSVADFVLETFASQEQPLLPDLLDAGIEALKLTIRAGLSQAMNQVNRKAQGQPSNKP